MTQTCTAVFENGRFRPVTALGSPLTEGQQVQLVVEVSEPHDPDEMLNLAAQVYAGLPEEEVAEVEAIALERK